MAKRFAKFMKGNMGSHGPGADGYERKTVQGYAHKGKVAKLLAEGWEIEHWNPVDFKVAGWGNTLKQGMFILRRKVADTERN